MDIWTTLRQSSVAIRPSLCHCQADDNTDTLEPLLVIRTSNGNSEWKYVLQHSLKSTHPPELKRKSCVFLYHGKWSRLLLGIVLGEHAAASRRSTKKPCCLSLKSSCAFSHLFPWENCLKEIRPRPIVPPLEFIKCVLVHSAAITFHKKKKTRAHNCKTNKSWQ